jgi:hypothetical protein
MAMAKGKRRVKDEVIFVGIFIAIIIFALILGWWQEHSAIGWTILGILVVLFGFSLYRFPRFRGWIFKKGVSASKKAVFTDEAPGREPIPQNLYNKVMGRANGSCENPACKSKVKPHIHHINKNNRDNDIRNLIALCPNCHTEAHNSDKFSYSQLRNFVRDSYNRQKARKKVQAR